MLQFSDITINWKPLESYADMPQITSSQMSADVLRTYWTDRLCYKEEFYILLLSQSNRVLGISKISEGGLSGTVVDVKMIFQAALKANAAKIILAHNHPSGNLSPSPQDRRLTRKICEAALLLDMRVLDHIILSYDDYYSFSDEGIL